MTKFQKATSSSAAMVPWCAGVVSKGETWEGGKEGGPGRASA